MARRKTYFTEGVMKPWPRLPIEVGDTPSLGTFKVRLDGTLSSLIWLKMLTAGWLEEMTSKSPFQPKAFCDSMIIRKCCRVCTFEGEP